MNFIYHKSQQCQSLGSCCNIFYPLKKSSLNW